MDPEPLQPHPRPEPRHARPAAPPLLWGPLAAGLLTAGLLLLHVGLQLLVLLVLGFPGTTGAPPFGRTLALSLLVATAPVVALLLALAQVRQRAAEGTAVSHLGLTIPGGRASAAWLAATAAFLALWEVADRVFDRPPVPEFLFEAWSSGGSSGTHLLLVLALVAAAPAAEELLFRGLLLPSLAATRLGTAGAVVATSAVWSSTHLQYDLYDVTGVFLAGLLLGAMRLRTSSTLLPIAAHALVNAAATVEVAWLVR